MDKTFIFFHKRFQFFLRNAIHLAFHPSDFLFHIDHRLLCRKHFFIDRAFAVDYFVLRQITDRFFFGNCYHPIIRFQFFYNHL